MRPYEFGIAANLLTHLEQALHFGALAKDDIRHQDFGDHGHQEQDGGDEYQVVEHVLSVGQFGGCWRWNT